MKKFKSGDLCEIVEIDPEDSYFGEKEELIKKKFTFRWYVDSFCTKKEDGFIGCMLYIQGEYENEGHCLQKAICFSCVKLKKVV